MGSAPVTSYQLRGGLLGGPSSCDPAADRRDYYSRFDQAYPQISAYLGSTAGPTADYSDLWWNPNESGWGLNIAHQGDILFTSWFT